MFIYNIYIYIYIYIECVFLLFHEDAIRTRHCDFVSGHPKYYYARAKINKTDTAQNCSDLVLERVPGAVIAVWDSNSTQCWAILFGDGIEIHNVACPACQYCILQDDGRLINNSK